MNVTINGINVDRSKLLSKDELLEYLRKNGECDRSLADIRERNQEQFDNELMWRYPISEGFHLGIFIVCVREGFISLPYDDVDHEAYELLILEDTAMLNAEDFEFLISDWELFSNDLKGALQDMEKILEAAKTE